MASPPARESAPDLPPLSSECALSEPALWTRPFILLLASNVAFYFGFQLLVASLPLYTVHLGGGEAVAGLVTGLFTLTAMLVRPLTGWGLDAYGRRSIWRIATIGCLFAVAAQGFAGTLVLLLLLRMVNGVFFGVSTTAGGAVAGDSVPTRRLGEGMGFVAVTMGVSLGVAPPLGLWLAGRGQYGALFVVAAVCTAIALALQWNLGSRRPSRPHTTDARLSLRAMYEPTALFPSVLMLLLITGFGMIMALLALSTKERGIGGVGLWFTVYAVALTLARSGTGRMSDRWGYRQTAIFGLIFATAGLSLIAAAQNEWMLLTSGVLFGLGFGTTQPSLQAMLVERSPRPRLGAATAMFFFAYDLGMGVGSVVGGVLAGAIGMQSVFALGVLGPLGGIALLVGHLRRLPRPVRAAP